MSDPTVTSYLTKLLCSHGGRLERNQLDDLLELPAEQIEQILEDEPLKFPQNSKMVLARSPLRICIRYLRLKGKEEEEECPKLHMCRQYLRGHCSPNRRPPCRFSHDVQSDHNSAVLKANELSSLNEDEIIVLLFQNDNQLLPENCEKYMHSNCDQGEDCSRLHVCRYFIRGECNNRFCKRSHNLLGSKSLLTCSWLSQETIQNFQILCVLTHNERQQAQREESRHEKPRDARGRSRGRSRRRPEDKRRAGSQDLLKDGRRERSYEGFLVWQQSDRHPPSQRSGGHHLEDENDNSDCESDRNDRNLRTRLDSLMDDWFSPNLASSGNVQVRSSATSTWVTPQEEIRSVPSTKGQVLSSKVNGTALLPTPALPVEFLNSRYTHALPSTPFNIPKLVHDPPKLGHDPPKLVHDPPNTSSVESILFQKSYQPYTHAPYSTTAQTRPADSLSVKDYNLSNTPIISPIKEPLISQPTPLIAPSQPTYMSLKSGPSNSSPKPLTASTSFKSSIGHPSTQLKPLSVSTRLPSHPSSLTSNKLVTTSTKSAEPGIIQYTISAKPSSVSSKSENSSPNQNKLVTTSTKSAEPGTLPANPSSVSIKSENSSPNQTLVKNLDIKVCSPVAGPANVKTIPSSTSKTSLCSASESPSIVQHKPATSTVAAHSEPSSSLPGISSIPRGAERPLRKQQTDVKLKTKSDAASGIQHCRSDSKGLQPQPTSSMASKPQPTTNLPSVTPWQSLPEKMPEICPYHICENCVFGDTCAHIHYDLPYRWQMFNRTDWEDLPNMEKLEKAFSDPSKDCYYSVDFQLMRSNTNPVRRLSTPSSLTRSSTYGLNTKWIWYWKDELGNWTKCRQSNTNSSPSLSSELETIYLLKPTGTVPITSSNQKYILNCQKMRLKNVYFMTEWEVRRRPKFLDSGRVKMLRGSIKSDASNSEQEPADSPPKAVNYPPKWDLKAVPHIGYQKVRVPQTCDEFSNIVKVFNKTLPGHKVEKMWRVQNPTLWQAYQCQKDQMKKKNSGIDVDERQLFYGTNFVKVAIICRDNFDWTVRVTHSPLYGQGNYFARDASYAHKYSPDFSMGTRTMFVARVLVHDFAKGNPAMGHPPQKDSSADSCVNSVSDPSVVVVFENSQVYPEYILEYKKEKKKSDCVIS